MQLGCTFEVYYELNKGRKEVWNTKSRTERQQMIREILSDRRFETIANLSHELDVSVRTIKHDIEVISCSTPIYTTRGQGGGVHAVDGWYVTHRYLHDDQEALLRSLMAGLSQDKQKIIQDILTAFAKPAV